MQYDKMRVVSKMLNRSLFWPILTSFFRISFRFFAAHLLTQVGRDQIEEDERQVNTTLSRIQVS